MYMEFSKVEFGILQGITTTQKNLKPIGLNRRLYVPLLNSITSSRFWQHLYLIDSTKHLRSRIQNCRNVALTKRNNVREGLRS